MSIAKKGSSKSIKRPFIDSDYEIAMQTPWPDNPNGYVIAQKQIEHFIGSQVLYEAQITAERFVVVAEAAQAIARGEKINLNRRLIRYIAVEDPCDDYRQVMKAMMTAIEAGEAGIRAAYGTARYLLEFGFEYTACCNREMVYKKGLSRMRRASSSKK